MGIEPTLPPCRVSSAGLPRRVAPAGLDAAVLGEIGRADAAADPAELALRQLAQRLPMERQLLGDLLVHDSLLSGIFNRRGSPDCVQWENGGERQIPSVASLLALGSFASRSARPDGEPPQRATARRQVTLEMRSIRWSSVR